MKTYSETMKSVLERAAVITEEKQAKAKKTRSRLKTVLGAALALTLVIGAVLVIKPFGERGNSGQLGYGAKNTSDAAKVTPDCMEDNTHKNTPEPATSVFITDTTAVKSYEQGDSVNAELALSMLRSEGYIEADTGTLRVNYYNTSGSVLRNCTPDYILEHGGDVDLFQDESGAYFIRLLDQLYRYDSFGGRHINMCRWDYDSNGAADLVFYSNSGSGLDYHSVSIFDLSTRTIKDIIVKMTLAEPSFRFDFDGESIYIDGNKVEYIGGEFYIGGVNADEYKSDPYNSEPPKGTPEPTPSDSFSPRFFTGAIMVKSYDEGDELNSELALSMLRSNSFIIAETGESCIDFDASDFVLRNCTSDYVREHAPDIELFQNRQYGSYFIRIGDTLYSYNSGRMGDYIQMCLWDYDNNGVDDIVLSSTAGSGILYLNTEIFDVTTKAVKKLSTVYLRSAYMFELQFDGTSIYIDGNKVEYVDGEFYIGGMKAEDYRSSQFEPKNTPEPSDHPSYAYPDILCIAPDDFSFTIQWGVGAYSSYDSKTGRLVKTTDTTHPEDYVTHLSLSEYEINRFYTFITWHMDIFKLPDEYDPINDPSSKSKIQSEPYETIILTVRADGREKTVTCPEIPLGDHYGYCHHAYTFYNMTVRYITDLLMSSPEWQALPEYEFFYE